MPESAKEGATGLPEGSDIGLGPGDRAFEPHYSDQKPSEIVDFRGLSYSLSIAAQEVSLSFLTHLFDKRRLNIVIFAELQYN